VADGTISVSLDGPDDELRSLAGWLRDEDDLRGRVVLANKPIERGEMGGVLAAVEVIATGGTAKALVTSLFEWLRHRRTAMAVTLKIRDGKGRELDLTCGSADDATVLLDKVQSILSNEN
jgi:hypothetical protein